MAEKSHNVFGDASGSVKSVDARQYSIEPRTGPEPFQNGEKSNFTRDTSAKKSFGKGGSQGFPK